MNENWKDNGYNPMRWDCSRQGCFNKKCRPKIEQFASALPGRISFSDVDGIVEVNHNFLLLEWKSAQSISTGQKLLYQRITKNSRFTVLVVVGNAETMNVSCAMLFQHGQGSPWYKAKKEDISRWIAQWAAHALSTEVNSCY